MSQHAEHVRTALAATEQQCEELARAAQEWKCATRQTISEMQRGTRIMVTAPKVCINIGGNEKELHVPFPFQRIKESVAHELMPKFAKVSCVADSMGDEEIRADVQKMVESLALMLQSKVCELMPQAEGTCQWDGFGAKCGSLGCE